MTTDKTGAQTEVRLDGDRFAITADGQPAGAAYFADRDDTRIFYHTEVDDQYQGRGLATILVGEGLAATRDAGMRIVPMCEVVAAYIDNHPEFSSVVDSPTPDIENWLKTEQG